MDAQLRMKIDQAVMDSYGDRASPNWSFKSKQLERKPYDEVLKSLQKIGIINETTDLNYDNSRTINIQSEDGATAVVWLSLVGKFACMTTIAGPAMTIKQVRLTANFGSILDLLDKHHICFIEPTDLRDEFEFDGRQVSVFSILFYDS